MLRIIFNNLLNNAVKFSRMNSEIHVSILETEDEYRIEILDSGEGVSPEFMESLFTLNQNKIKKGTASESGHGLGLVLVKNFVKSLNGKILYTNEPEVGSRFSVILKK